MSRAPFLKWALVQSIFGACLTSAILLYPGDVHTPAKVGAASAIALYVIASVAVGRAAWNGQPFPRLGDLVLGLLPMVAIMGVVSGWLIALSGSTTADVQQKILGASSGLSASFVAAACLGVLMIQEFLLGRPKGGCGCREA